MRIGLKTSLGCLGIAALVGAVGWLSAITHETVRTDVESLRRSSMIELVAATDMLVALKAVHAAAQELVVEAWRVRFEAYPAWVGAGDADRATARIESGLATFAADLAASRRATEAALALREEHGDVGAAAEEQLEMGWLDQLGVALVAHRTRLAELALLARTDAPAAGRFLEDHVEPHYSDVILPLIRQYQQDAQAELNAVVVGVDQALAASDRRNKFVTAAAGVLAVVLGLLLARSIARPIEALADVAYRIGGGDLDARVRVRSTDEVGVLADTVNGMAARLQATMVSKSYVDDILRSMGEILLVSDPEGRIRTVNRAAEEQLGWSERELVGRVAMDIVRPAEKAGELRVVSRDGAVIPVACTPTDLHDGNGQPHGRVWVAQNIRHQKAIERDLRRSLEEKEVLLREVHHRVKNNLQVICSLLQLQAAHAAAPEIARHFADSESRVRAMALIHEQLYRSGDLARIDFRAYVEGLARNVLASTGGTGRSANLQVDIDPVPLDLDVAILCGLILNELLANAFKHAFPAGRAGEIAVRFQQHGGRAILTVADDGIGFGSAGDAAAPASLGLRLVRAFATQLGADTTLDGAAGTRVTVAFDLPAANGRRADTAAAG